jgi:hypothetical protein
MRLSRSKFSFYVMSFAALRNRRMPRSRAFSVSRQHEGARTCPLDVQSLLQLRSEDA